jgi:hypothetical protein
VEVLGTQFTCFTGTNVPILTQKALLDEAVVIVSRAGRILQVATREILSFTCTLLALLVQMYKY